MSISQIDSSGISSVSSANITGLIQSSQIANISNTQITGLIQSNQIANISNTQIVGTTLPGPGQVTNIMLDTGSSTGNGAIFIPKGTSAQRPTANQVGYLRFNTDLGVLENYTANGWFNVSLQPPTIVSVSGTIYYGNNNTLVITGTNFSISSGTLTFTNGSNTTTISVSPSSTSSLTVSVPAVISNSAIGSTTTINYTAPSGLNTGAVSLGTISTLPDALYSYTKVLVKNGSTTDASNSRRTLTNSGAYSSSSVGTAPVQKLSNSLCGTNNNSWYVDSGTSNYLSFAAPYSDFDMGQTAWTLEFWINTAVTGGSYAHIFWCGGQTGQGEVKMWSSDGKPYIYSAVGSSLSSSVGVTSNTWTWVVFERYNGTISCWINGTRTGQSTTMPTGGTPSIAALGYTFQTEYWPHYLDEVRWSTVARYQGAATIPMQTQSWPEHS